METPMQFNQEASVSIERHRGAEDDFRPKGHFVIEHFDKDGNLKGKYLLRNGITNGGKDYNLGVAFKAVTRLDNWYIGLVDDSGFTSFAAGDTMGSHAGWTEFTDYSEGTRPEWAPDAPSGQAITNGTARDFTMSGSGDLKGLFIVSVNVKGGSGGTLWSTAGFPSVVPVSASDVIKGSYTITT